MSPGNLSTTAPAVAATLRGALLAALLAGLVACGTDDDTATDTATDGASETASASASASDSTSASASSTPSESASPSLPSTTDATQEVALAECSTIWVVGQQLPAGYPGCTESGKVVQANGLYCEFGKPLFTYANRFYAVENGPINQTEKVLAKDKAYQQALRKCGG